MQGCKATHTSQKFNLLPPDWTPEPREFHAADAPILAPPFEFYGVIEFATTAMQPIYRRLGRAEGQEMPKKILIVEDNELNMKLFHDLLEVHGYTTLQTRDGILDVECRDVKPLTHHRNLTFFHQIGHRNRGNSMRRMRRSWRHRSSSTV